MDEATIEEIARTADSHRGTPYPQVSDRGDFLYSLDHEQVQTTKPLKRVFDEGLLIFLKEPNSLLPEQGCMEG